MRKKKKQDNRLYCPYCGRQAVLRPATYVYGERNLDPENYLYVCGGYPACDSYIGVHKKSLRPMGTLADGNLRHKRIEAHRALNEVINAGVMTKHGLGKEKAMEWADEEDFRFCLNRLVRRGLVARCEGETKEEALFFLFQRAVLKPICYSFSDRMRSFTDSLVMGKGIKFALRAFQKPTFSYEEHKVFTQIVKNGTISDHLCSLQEETQKVPVAEKQKWEILEQVSQEYLRILVSLYKKKQLVISCIREEGGLEAKERMAAIV